LDEGLAVLTGLWRGAPFSYDGTQYQVHNVCFLPLPVQQPRIPVWVAGTWPLKAPFRRAARWDVVFSLSRDPFTKPLTPADIRDMIAYIKEHRASADAFEVVHVGRTPGKDDAEDTAIVAPYAEAGLTWWLESTRRRSLAEVHERIRKGPPSV
jgi:alkanesulfonate monooxygenase SsuD/methylene tetrahydromethanopterin reductase-like flavin-dependent oxidoreductase (luciferase family)